MTGWQWDYVEDNLTMIRLKALQDEWRRIPPMSVMLAAHLGIKPKEEGSTEELVEKIINMPTSIIK